MIGNTIEFNLYQKGSFGEIKGEPEKTEGLVVDSWTNVSGIVQGETFFGFGETNGSTESHHIYKVQYYRKWDSKKEHPCLIDIQSWMIPKIITLSQVPCQGNEQIIR